jgi:hypothetical protein
VLHPIISAALRDIVVFNHSEIITRGCGEARKPYVVKEYSVGGVEIIRATPIVSDASAKIRLGLIGKMNGTTECHSGSGFMNDPHS